MSPPAVEDLQARALFTLSEYKTAVSSREEHRVGRDLVRLMEELLERNRELERRLDEDAGGDA